MVCLRHRSTFAHLEEPLKCQMAFISIAKSDWHSICYYPIFTQLIIWQTCISGLFNAWEKKYMLHFFSCNFSSNVFWRFLSNSANTFKATFIPHIEKHFSTLKRFISFEKKWLFYRIVHLFKTTLIKIERNSQPIKIVVSIK